jgi:hypothetical protein
VLPLIVLALVKHRRRLRRLFAPSRSQSVVGGWQEVLDQAADIGEVAPPSATRTQVSGMLANRYQVTDLTGLAVQADASAFGPAEPSEDALEKYWDHVQTVCGQLRAELSLWGRYRATVSLTSLRRQPKPTLESADFATAAAATTAVAGAAMPQPPDEPAPSEDVAPAPVSSTPAPVSPLDETALAEPPTRTPEARPSTTTGGFVETPW